MRQTVFMWILLIAALSFSAGCGGGNNSRPTANGVGESNASSARPADGVRRVSVEELKAALEKNEAVVIDVRGEVEYDMGHIRGSRSLPLGLITSRADELPRDKLIVTYCA
jgi:predicted sulfurtransferase